MSSSGSFDWTATRNEIIDRILRILRVLDEEDSASPFQLKTTSEVLNAKIKEWQGDGLQLWKLKWLTETLTAADEVLGDVDGLNYTCIKSTNSLETAEIPNSGANWTNRFIKSGTSGVGVATATTAYNAIGDIDLTNKILGIQQAFIRDIDSTDNPLDIITMQEYMELPNKFTPGTPSKIAIDTSDLTAPRIYLWPQPNVATTVLHIYGITRLEDFDAGEDTPDFDQLWINAIVLNVADDLKLEYSYPSRDSMTLERKALKAFKKAKGSTTSDRDDLDIQVRFR